MIRFTRTDTVTRESMKLLCLWIKKASKKKKASEENMGRQP